MKRGCLTIILGVFFICSCGDGSGPGGPGPGNGDDCGTCNSGFKCGNSGVCELDPSGFWVVTVTNGWVYEKQPDGTSWDSFGGAPDPFVCLTINGDRKCTIPAKDTSNPSWNGAYPKATATALQTGVKVEYWDEDISGHDEICKASTISFSTNNFKTGAVKIACGNPEYANFNMTLTAQ